MSATHGPARRPMIAAVVSLVVGSVLLAAKYWAWLLTDSQTVFSDAMESIVNVVASAAALLAVYVASMPADRNHPYGHGKIEFVTAAFEGGLIVFAGVVIVYEAAQALWAKTVPQRLDLGMGVVAAAGVANLFLGMYLVRTGKRANSPALVADGKHVMSDFWTSAGATAGLLLVYLTEVAWIDPIVAICVALHLLWTGLVLVREAARGLLDETDPRIVAELAESLEAERREGVIEVHQLRAISVGGSYHVDAHVVVPEFWTVDHAHDEIDRLERDVLARFGRPGEMAFHVDPCEAAYCERCDYPDCPIRVAPFGERPPLTAHSVERGPRPVEGHEIHSHGS